MKESACLRAFISKPRTYALAAERLGRGVMSRSANLLCAVVGFVSPKALYDHKLRVSRGASVGGC